MGIHLHTAVVALTVLSTTPCHLLAESPSTASRNAQVMRIISSTLYVRCLQMDTLACLGLKVLNSVGHRPQMGDAGARQQETVADRVLEQSLARALETGWKADDNGNDEEDSKDEEAEGSKDTVFGRGSLFSKKVMYSLLVGVVLKLGSLVPLVLAKLSFIGFLSFLSSKMSLLIFLLMTLKKWFSGVDSTGQPFGTHDTSPLGFLSHSHSHSFQHHHDPHSHALHQHVDQHAPLHDVGSNLQHHAAAHSGFAEPLALPHYRRKTYVIRGRQLGPPDLWSAGDNDTLSQTASSPLTLIATVGNASETNNDPQAAGTEWPVDKNSTTEGVSQVQGKVEGSLVLHGGRRKRSQGTPTQGNGNVFMDDSESRNVQSEGMMVSDDAQESTTSPSPDGARPSLVAGGRPVLGISPDGVNVTSVSSMVRGDDSQQRDGAMFANSW